MRTPAALVAIPLIAGAAAGLLLPELPAYRLGVCGAGAAVLCLVAAWGALGNACDRAGDGRGAGEARAHRSASVRDRTRVGGRRGDGSGDGIPGGVDDTAVLLVAVVMGCVAAGISLGVSAARETYAPPLLEWWEGADSRGDPVLLEGILREDAQPGALGISLTIDVLRVEGHETRGGVRLSIGGVPPEGAAAAWRAGRGVRLPALLRVPARYVDPGVPDEVRALARRGIVLVGSVKSAALVEVVGRGSAVDEAAAAAREWARVELARHAGRWEGQSGAIAAAILIGDRSGLSDEDQRRLQEAGTYHVIAISGGNIAILTTLLMGAMALVRLPGRGAAAVAMAVLLFYGRLTGNSASVARAVTAACVFLAGRVLDHRGPALNALAVAAAAAAAMSPVVVFDAGFVLSFGASLGILLGAGRIGGPHATRQVREQGAQAGVVRADAIPGARAGVIRGRAGCSRALRAISDAALAMTAATLSAEAAILPVSAAVFSRVTFAGLVLNFAAIPLMAVVQGAAMVTLAAAGASRAAASTHATIPAAALAGGFARVAGVAGYVTHLGAVWLVRSASLVDYVPWLSRDVVPPAWGLVAAYYAAIVLLAWRRARPVAAWALAAAVVSILSGPAVFTRDAVARAPHGWLRVVFLDVGQGDSTLLQLPDGRALLVDAGGQASSSFDIGARVVAPALRAFGVRALDTLVVTHGDPDHLGGAPAILRGFHPRAIWEGVPVRPHVKLRELADAAAAAGVAWRSVQAGDRERDGGVEIGVLHPPPPDWERQRVRNEDSIVLEVRIGDVSIVLPGDVGAEGERALLRQFAPARVVVVKAPHHGSASSSTPAFVGATHPAAVVFSAGRGNRFGHPAPAVVERYRAAGAQVFATAELGAIVLDTDGSTLKWGHSPLR